MTERFMVDDCGTLIDMISRDTYDYVSDVCPLLNALVDENEQLKQQIQTIKDILINLIEIEVFWDSAILQKIVDKIAEIISVDLER